MCCFLMLSLQISGEYFFPRGMARQHTGSLHTMLAVIQNAHISMFSIFLVAFHPVPVQE